MLNNLRTILKQMFCAHKYEIISWEGTRIAGERTLKKYKCSKCEKIVETIKNK